MPNFCYSSELNEFRQPPLTFTDPLDREPRPNISSHLMYGSKALQEATEMVHSTTQNVFRVEHACAIVRLVGAAKLGALINELCQNVGLEMVTVIRPFTQALCQGMPKDIKPPDAFYGTSGGFGYYQAHLKPILQYPDLSTEVYQVFRAVGNTLALIGMIELALEQLEDLDLVQTTFFGQTTPPSRQFQFPSREEVGWGGGWGGGGRGCVSVCAGKQTIFCSSTPGHPHASHNTD